MTRKLAPTFLLSLLATTGHALASQTLEGPQRSVSPVAQVVARGVDLAQLDGWNIVVGRDATEAEQYAAEEFRRLFIAAGGAALPIVSADEVDRPGRHVFIGSSKAMRNSDVGFSTEGFGPEDLRIVARNDAIAIAGGRPRGTLYGVYTFVEDYLGVRFLTAEVTHIPPIGEMRIVGPVDRFYHPPMSWRNVYYREIYKDSKFAARLRTTLREDIAHLGGTSRIPLIMHGIAGMCPTSKYGVSHPEYFAMKDGKRVAGPFDDDHHHTNPCPSHPDVVKIVGDQAIRRLEADPSRDLVSISYGDNNMACECPVCEEINQREGSQMAALMLLINKVAERVEQEYPGKKVGVLAYWPTRKPPKTITCRENVSVMYCPIEISQVHEVPDDGCAENIRAAEELKRWMEICNDVYVWEYSANFEEFQVPFPNLRVMGQHLRFYAATGVEGVFCQASAETASSEFADLRAYVLTNVLWDPSRDPDALREEFISLYYGETAHLVRRHIDRVHDLAEATGRCLTCYGYGDPPFPEPRANYPAFFGLTQEAGWESLTDLDEALKIAESDEMRDRIQKLRMSALRWVIDPVWHLTSPDQLTDEMDETMRPLVREFFELAETYDYVQESWCRPLAVRSWQPKLAHEPSAHERLSKVFDESFAGGLEKREEVAVGSAE